MNDFTLIYKPFPLLITTWPKWEICIAIAKEPAPESDDNDYAIRTKCGRLIHESKVLNAESGTVCKGCANV